MVPLLYFYYGSRGWAPVAIDPAMHAAIAHATSLFVIVPTAVRGTLSYHRSGLIEWRAVLPIALGSIAAAVIGARVALQLPAPMLKVGFGVFLLLSGIQLLVRRPAPDGSPLHLSVPAMLATGLASGFFSALLGVGGGLVAIPLLIYATRLPLERVAATSLAVVVCAATAGVITYIASGWGAAGLPPVSLGYVDVGAGIPMLIGALLSVRSGSRVNQRLDSQRLRRLFGILLIGLGGQIVIANALALV
jgi:uncharacterized membrane protein YfcA